MAINPKKWTTFNCDKCGKLTKIRIKLLTHKKKNTINNKAYCNKSCSSSKGKTFRPHLKGKNHPLYKEEVTLHKNEKYYIK